MSLIQNLFGKKDATPSELVVYVVGMSCSHCQANVEKTLKALKGVQDVTVDLETGKTVINGTVDVKTVRKAIEGIGFSLKD